ncbi:hypothetical protein PP175_11765 [Aneurinibacillus sp. Ricciae_BoGa-3]|uniref:VC0807 family protein n=1 Tax=Aneurinibacillus sp. Ricciae_BoGa-3 TaxID=3022697 RepID=UPI00233FB706|nr:VC0807 family protein [Aneurinibacillus sp. Ricciae_BoGa-3]WCK56522.1 hypothetical protein PP175_11765 [Aneurinibacillus sp. Ricciae_BoGa-3]
MERVTNAVTSNKNKILRGVLITLALNGLLPLLVYEYLCSYMPSVTALSIATVIPLVDNFYSLIKHRHLDVFAVFMLVGFVLGLLVVAFGGDEHLILIRESFVTGFMGIFLLASFLFRRPFIYYFALRFIAGNDQARKADFAVNWQYPYFRFVLRLMTFVWGMVLLGEAAVKTILVYKVSIPLFLSLSNFITYGFIGAAILWTVTYRRHARKRLANLNHKQIESYINSST